MKKKQLTDKERLISGWVARIKMHRKQLSAARATHRQVEGELVKKIKLEEIQLRALRKK